MQQDGVPSHSAKNILAYLRREFVLPYTWHRIAGKTLVTLFGVLFNRRCTTGNDSVEQLQHVVITEWDKLAFH